MATQFESPMAVSGTSPKTLQLLRKRLHQAIRVTLVLAICLAVAASAVAIWWLTSLNRLPDIGDPFDVAAFKAFSIPDDRNAFTPLRRADEKATPSPSGLARSWAQADPTLRAWVEANHQALQLFQQGADQSDAANPNGDSLVNGQRVALLVLLEADRRQASGDMAGAWDCHRAILRMATHIRRRGSFNQRVDLYDYWDGLSRQRLATWVADPRTSIPQLHGALEEVQKSEPKPDWDSFALKAGYLAMKSSLEQPVPTLVQQDVGWEYHFGVGDMELSSDMADYLDSGWRFLLREPERSRRVLQLVYANWLAQVESLEPRKPAVRALFSLLTSTNPVSWSTTNVTLYAVSPSAPAGARILSAEQIASWLVSTNDAKLRVIVANSNQWPWSPDRLRDRREYHDLVLMLAGEIYHREHGMLPPSDEALLGTYLKRLPDNSLIDQGDEMPAIVK
jgi:hypothetical protein